MNSQNQYDSRVAVPTDYFYKMSMMDYGNPYMAVIREFFQNSVDAGCKTFIMVFDETTKEIFFIDDGCGMSEDVIRNRLLVMGGSYKESNNAIGSFGHAKVLIYFSWEEYEILTRNLRVTGKANMYTIEKYDSNDKEYINGTVSRILVNEEAFRKIKNEVDDYFNFCNTDVVVKCVIINENGDYVTNIKQNLINETPIYINLNNFIDVFIGNDLRPYQKWDWLSHNKYAYIRSNGVYMFCTYVDVLKMPVVVETKAPAREIFTQNRDTFKGEYDKIYGTFISKITNDNVSSIDAAFQSFISKKSEKKKSGKRGRNKSSERSELFEYDNNFYIWGKTINETKTYFKKARIKRLHLFFTQMIERYYKINSTDSDVKITGGFVFDSSVRGVVKLNGDKSYILFINPLVIEEYVKNKREMCWKFVNIFCHELAHIKTCEEDSTMYHNEGFVLNFHKMEELFWDNIENYRIFKNCWDAFIK